MCDVSVTSIYNQVKAVVEMVREHYTNIVGIKTEIFYKYMYYVKPIFYCWFLAWFRDHCYRNIMWQNACFPLSTQSERFPCAHNIWKIHHEAMSSNMVHIITLPTYTRTSIWAINLRGKDGHTSWMLHQDLDLINVHSWVWRLTSHRSTTSGLLAPSWLSIHKSWCAAFSMCSLLCLFHFCKNLNLGIWLLKMAQPFTTPISDTAMVKKNIYNFSSLLKHNPINNEYLI